MVGELDHSLDRLKRRHPSSADLIGQRMTISSLGNARTSRAARPWQGYSYTRTISPFFSLSYLLWTLSECLSLLCLSLNLVPRELYKSSRPITLSTQFTVYILPSLSSYRIYRLLLFYLARRDIKSLTITWTYLTFDTVFGTPRTKTTPEAYWEDFTWILKVHFAPTYSQTLLRAA